METPNHEFNYKWCIRIVISDFHKSSMSLKKGRIPLPSVHSSNPCSRRPKMILLQRWAMDAFIMNSLTMKSRDLSFVKHSKILAIFSFQRLTMNKKISGVILLSEVGKNNILVVAAFWRWIGNENVKIPVRDEGTTGPLVSQRRACCTQHQRVLTTDQATHLGNPFWQFYPQAMQAVG